MATKKEAEKEVKSEQVKAEQVEPVQVEAEPVELSQGEAGGTPSTEPQPLQEPGKETVMINPQGDKPPLDEAPLNPDEIVLWRNDTNAPVLLGETYLFPSNSRKARRGDGAGKGLTEL